MATVSIDGRTTPPLGVIHAVLGVLATADTWSGEPVADTFERLLEVIEEDDAALLPSAIGECLLPLRSCPDAMNLALDIVRGFDLHEAAGGLIPLLREAPGRLAVETAAALAPHPDVPSILGELAELASAHATDDADSLRRRLQVLLSGTLPEGAIDADAWMLAERWPGRVQVSEAAAPLLAVCDDAAPPHQTLEFLLEARRAGAQVRRVSGKAVPQPLPGWLPDWGVVIAAETRPSWWPESAAFRATGRTLGPGSRRELLRWLARRLKGPLQLRPTMSGRQRAKPLEDPLLSIDAFFDGALKIPEVSFLTGWSSATVRQRGKYSSALRSRSAGPMGFSVFDFAQTTALRVERYVTRKLGRRGDPDLATELVKMAQSERTVPTHVTSVGDVLFEADESTVMDKHGQTSFAIVALTDIARSFELGMGHAVPELLHPSTHTSVHPSIQRGSPVVSATRISATAVRDVAQRARAGGFHGEELERFVRDYFPELTREQIRDADAVGQQILA